MGVGLSETTQPDNVPEEKATPLTNRQRYVCEHRLATTNRSGAGKQ